MKRAAVLAAVLLTGCAAYNPVALRVTNQAQYDADVAFCAKASAAYKAPGLDVEDILTGAATGAAQGAPGGVIGGPLIPAVGAIGGATNAFANDENDSGHAQKNVNRNCLHDATMQDHSAIVADPED